MVIWCAVVFFVLNNDLYGEFNPVLYWSAPNADTKSVPGRMPPETDQDAAPDPGDDEPPIPQ